jgi:hypothetical protein
VARPAARSLTITQQAWALTRLYPDVERPVIRHGRLRWRIQLQPTPISVAYTVLFDYTQGRSPRVFVVEPELQVRPGESLPHTFGPAGGLCLYYDEFSVRRDYIADILVPWAAEWLLHYELWLATGEWHGGEVDHAGTAARPKGSQS